MAVKSLLKGALRRLAVFAAVSLLSFFVGTVTYTLGAHTTGYLIILTGITGGLLWALPNKANLALAAILMLISGLLILTATGLLLKVLAGVLLVSITVGFIFAGIAQYRSADPMDPGHPIQRPSYDLIDSTESERYF